MRNHFAGPSFVFLGSFVVVSARIQPQRAQRPQESPLGWGLPIARYGSHIVLKQHGEAGGLEVLIIGKRLGDPQTAHYRKGT